MLFEVVKSDLRGRIGVLHTNHGIVQTPAYVPVVHPVRQTIPAEKIAGMGFEMVITNAYITMKRYGEEAERRGIHDIINFDGAVMTDSGGYQVLEYGDLETTPSEMARFERSIRADIAVPLDKPTGFGLSRGRADRYVRHTLEVSRLALSSGTVSGQIWMGPIQGGEHSDLVAKSASGLVDAGFGMLALGSPVEFMESYEYRLLARMIMAAKRRIPHSIPLHLFGAGHPLTIPLSVALGCDTFDSASYMLYAKHGRYMTEDGTRHVSDMLVLPCSCEVCSTHTPGELLQMDRAEMADKIAVHNLHAIKDEVDRTRQAIFEGRLWEYAMKKARAHPRLFEAVGALLGDPRYAAESTPAFKERAIFLYDAADQFRPEAVRYRETVSRFRTKKKKLFIMKEPRERPAYLSGNARAAEEIGDAADIQVCHYTPHLGMIPLELSDMFPAAHHETARVEFDPAEYAAFGDSLERFVAENGFTDIYYDMGDGFLGYFVGRISGVKRHGIK